MSYKIKSLLFIVGSAAALLLALYFFSKAVPMEARMSVLTKQMVEENQEQIRREETKRQNAETARRKAALEAKLYQCTANDECVMVDKDPCGCLKGPEGVTAINSSMSLEFSRLMEKQFSSATACPSVGSVERECSATARAECRHGRCKIVY